MRAFVGCVIAESLTTEEPLTGLEPVTERAVDMPGDPDAAVWHPRWYQVDEADLRGRLPALARALRPNWYAHFWEGDDLCVILPGRVFWAKASDRTTWRDFIAYGETVGVGRRWTENVPTALPAWVQAAVAARRP